MANKLHPLHALLKQEVKWNWSDKCANVFKKYLSQTPILVHLGPKLPIRLAQGMLQIVESKVKSILSIAFTFHSLSTNGKNYSQVEKKPSH